MNTVSIRKHESKASAAGYTIIVKTTDEIICGQADELTVSKEIKKREGRKSNTQDSDH